MKLKISELGKVITGNTPSKKIKEFWDKDDVGFVKPDIISDEHIVKIKSENCNEFISNAAISKARIVPKNSIFVTCIGNIGKIGVATENLAFNQQINAIIPNENVNLDYLCYAIFANKTRLQDIANAPIVPLLNKSQFSEFELEFDMDINTQTRIVHELNTVSNIILKYKQELLLLDELVRARFVEMFGTVYDKKFDMKTLPDIVSSDKNSIKRGPFGGALKKDDFLTEGYLVYEQRHAIHEDFEYAKYYISKEKYESMIGFKVIPGDLIISCSGVTLGRIAEVPNGAKEGIINQALLKISLNKDMMNNKFFIHQFRCKEIQEMLFGFSRGSGIPNMPSMNEVKTFKFICPPLELQNQFASFVEEIDKSRLLSNHSLFLIKSIIF